jgi:hypothetical protein
LSLKESLIKKASKEELSALPQSLVSESEYQPDDGGIESSTSIAPPSHEPRSRNLDETDIRTDDVPRGIHCTVEPVESTNMPLAGAPFVISPAEDTHQLGVIPSQQMQTSSEGSEFLPLGVKVKQNSLIKCHPSKLIRDNSASTLQPPSKHIEHQEMAPSQILHLRVEEEGEELAYSSANPSVQDRLTLALDKTATEVVADSDDFDVSSSRRTPPRDNNDSDTRPSTIRSAVEAPPSPYRSSPPSLDDIHESGSVVVAPPGTIVFHHATSEHSYLPPAYQHHGYGYQIQVPVLQHGMHHQPQLMHTSRVTATPPLGGGRRKITLQLQEDAHDSSRRSFFFRRSSKSRTSPLQSIEEGGIDRGNVIVSWFEGTSSAELQEHVRKSVIRKMNLDSDARLADFRIMDQSETPPEGKFLSQSFVNTWSAAQSKLTCVLLLVLPLSLATEIVLSPFIPDGSSFLLRFRIQEGAQPRKLDRLDCGSDYSAPDSPSAAPSPFPSNLDLTKLNAQLLSGKLKALKPPLSTQPRKSSLKTKQVATHNGNHSDEEEEDSGEHETQPKKVDEADTYSKASDHHEEDVMGYNPEDQIEIRLRQIADLMIADRKHRKASTVLREKRQVIFVIANYFVLFLSFIAICAELSARSPQWLSSLEKQLDSVHKCSTDQEALFECVSRGDFAGLMASLVLVLTRSAATKRFFLFGFETPKKLWAVVYESMVTAVCWGISYIMIRRGMNPDTRCGFLRKYWKDAVYGSLAGFNAAFLKHVLKNLIPQETIEHALQERQLKILSWLPSFR